MRSYQYKCWSLTHGETLGDAVIVDDADERYAAEVFARNKGLQGNGSTMEVAVLDCASGARYAYTVTAIVTTRHEASNGRYLGGRK